MTYDRSCFTILDAVPKMGSTAKTATLELSSGGDGGSILQPREYL